MEKQDLKPRMKVRNKVSGSVAEVYGREGEPLSRADWCAPVRMRMRTKEGKGKFTYPIWSLVNLEVIK